MGDNSQREDRLADPASTAGEEGGPVGRTHRRVARRRSKSPSAPGSATLMQKRHSSRRKRSGAAKLGVLYAGLVEAMDTGVAIYRLEDPDDPTSLTLVAMNRAGEAATRSKARDLVGRAILEAFPGTALDRVETYAEVARSGKPAEIGDIRYTDERISETVFTVSAVPLPDRCVGLLFDNVTERRRVEDSLRQSEERYRFVAEHVHDVIYLYSFLPEPHFEYVSPSAKAVTGYAPEAYYRDPELLTKLLDPEDRPLFETVIRSGTAPDKPMLVRWVRKDGVALWTEQHIATIHDQAGNLAAFEVVARDVSDRIRAYEELERLRSNLLGTVSHELKTPLTAIKGSAATALGSSTPPDSEETRELFQIIDEQSDRLRGLVDDMLEMARIEAQEFSVDPQPVELSAILEEVRKVFAQSKRPHHLDIQVPRELPLVNADARRIVQVFTNLLRNAAQYSPPTSPIEVMVEHDGAKVTVRVRDHGRGIPPERMPHLFKKFTRIPGGGGRMVEGTGLGLAICKAIIESHGGRIWAESPGEGQGATFSFTLPTAEQVAVPKEAPSAGDLKIRRAGKKTRILALDDEPEIVRYLRRLLGEAGYDALVTTDPGEVPRLVEMEQPDLVLLDLRLPGTSGFELLRHIREFSAVPVIFLTASQRDEDLVQALRSGADDYVKKPFSPPELLARIDVALRQKATSDRGEILQPFVLHDLRIDFAERLVLLGNRPLSLSATEYKILCELAAHAGRVLTYDQILQAVWGLEYSGETELLRSFIRNLRKKLGDNARQPRYIINERQVGYRMPKPAA